MKIEQITGSSQYFLLHLCTQVKELKPYHNSLSIYHPNRSRFEVFGFIVINETRNKTLQIVVDW